MTFGSLFSGAGGFDLGIHRTGLECRWQCEIDPQASSVLANHWPDVTRLSDIRKVRKADLEPVDVIAGGFPCQDLSVAGNRKGLSGDRSGLFHELVRVVRLCRPRFVVWENVPGLLSSDDGRDLGRVLRGLADIGYFGAWRVLDARFFGVPQRRRRVFGVFARGRFGAERCAQILALTEGVPGHPPKGREAGQDVAFTLTSSVGRRGGQGEPWNTTLVAGTLTGGRPRGGYNARDESGLVPTMTSNGDAHSGFRNEHGLVVAARCETSRGHRCDGETDTLIAFSNRGNETELAETLRAASHGALPPLATHRGTPETVGPLMAGKTVKGHGTAGIDNQAVVSGHVAPVAQSVRRLTPRECERLMSWPDDWTRWDADGEEFADGPRYRMCGNGVVANVAEWIGRRLMTLEANA